MMHDDLFALQQKVAQKPLLESKLYELHTQRRQYDNQVISLRVAFRKEQEDVEKLEGRSLANYFYQVIGKLDDKLDDERKEAYAAKVKLDAAERELAGIESDIKEIQEQITDVLVAEARYKDALELKRRQLKDSGTQVADQILSMEERIAALQAQKQEIKEAISAGYSARSTADRILSELEDADGWNTWDNGLKVVVTNETVGEALKFIMPNKRAVLLLSFFMDYRDSEIARTLRITNSTVAYRKKQALKQLKVLLEGKKYG